MKVSIVGAGPAGLFFSILLKQSDATHDIIIYEQNDVNTTYGFGVGFSKGALNFLQKADVHLHKKTLSAAQHLNHLTITHQGESIPIFGTDFYGIERIHLLNLLRQQALENDVQILNNYHIENLNDLEDSDLIIGADGVNSVVRDFYKNYFNPHIIQCKNRLIWYATSKVTNGIELIFKETEVGLLIGHTYRYTPNKNTFVVECTPNAWHHAGFNTMSEKESQHYCENVFSEFLDGHPLISNHSFWFNPKIIKISNWVNGHVTLLGDALKTMHPSIGSGTRAAMQDAISLADACSENPTDIKAALKQFEQRHKPKANKIQQAALQSIHWYENVHERLHLSPYEFAYDYMMRTGKIDHNQMCKMDPDFVRAYESIRQ